MSDRFILRRGFLVQTLCECYVQRSLPCPRLLLFQSVLRKLLARPGKLLGDDKFLNSKLIMGQ